MLEKLEGKNIPSGLEFLVDGYVGYAKEIIVERAIVGIDGFKPVQRRLMYIANNVTKAKEFKKSAEIVSSTMNYHPHGDGSIYESMTKMTDTAGYLQTPFLIGRGNLGKLNFAEPAAHMRYTYAKLAPIAEELFGEMDGINMILTEDGEYLEPDILPVSFPSILTSMTSGIAVGMASSIHSNNFHEVLNATIEMERTGDIKGYLIPDYTSKGYIVHDEKEFRKIMDTGRGRVKVRGKWEVNGKTIVATEFPYNTTIKAIIDKIRKEDIQGVSRVLDSSGDGDKELTIECSNKGVVESVLNEVLRVTDLQMSLTTNITIIIDKKPRVLGVKELISEWLKFRKKVLAKQYSKDLESYNVNIERHEILVDLLKDEEKRLEFVSALTKKGEGAGRELLYKWYPQANAEIFEWILNMKLRTFADYRGREKSLHKLYESRQGILDALDNLGDVIVRQLESLNARYNFPRQTEVTDVDYTFEAGADKVIKLEPVPTRVIVDGKFIKKIRWNAMLPQGEGLDCKSDDVISFIDTHGRLLRVNLEQLDFVSSGDRGVYLPVYLETEDDFDVVAFDVVKDVVKGFVYADGFASVLDYGEWVDSKRITRITQNGVSPYASTIVGEIDFTKGTHLLLITKEGRFGFVGLDFKQKNRTSRTKLVGVKEGDSINTVVPVTLPDMLQLVNAPLDYEGKLKNLSNGDTFNSEYLATLMNK